MKNKDKLNTELDYKTRKICLSIVKEIKKQDKYGLFLYPPIDYFTDEREKELYKKEIKEPRDLTSITNNLNNSPNYTVKDFQRDIELCWANSLSFNHKETLAYKMALQFRDFSNKLYKDKGLLDLINKKEKGSEIEDEKDKNSVSSTLYCSSGTSTPFKINSKFPQLNKIYIRRKRKNEKFDNGENDEKNNVSSKRRKRKSSNWKKKVFLIKISEKKKYKRNKKNKAITTVTETGLKKINYTKEEKVIKLSDDSESNLLENSKEEETESLYQFTKKYLLQRKEKLFEEYLKYNYEEKKRNNKFRYDVFNVDDSS